jgi:hypothetical protein
MRQACRTTSCVVVVFTDIVRMHSLAFALLGACVLFSLRTASAYSYPYWCPWGQRSDQPSLSLNQPGALSGLLQATSSGFCGAQTKFVGIDDFTRDTLFTSEDSSIPTVTGFAFGEQTCSNLCGGSQCQFVSLQRQLIPSLSTYALLYFNYESGWGSWSTFYCSGLGSCDVCGVCNGGQVSEVLGITCGNRCNAASRPTLCANGGTCSGGTCICRPGYSGSFCTYDACSSAPCRNGGTCITDSNVGGAVCACMPYFTGTMCERINPDYVVGDWLVETSSTCPLAVSFAFTVDKTILTNSVWNRVRDRYLSDLKVPEAVIEGLAGQTQTFSGGSVVEGSVRSSAYQRATVSLSFPVLPNTIRNCMVNLTRGAVGTGRSALQNTISMLGPTIPAAIIGVIVGVGAVGLLSCLLVTRFVRRRLTTNAESGPTVQQS